MKIKRTKTGNKTSDSKHEIVKSELNGNTNSEDPSSSLNCKKLTNAIGVPSSPSSSTTKRGNNSHRKDKNKDKLQIKDKSDNVLPNQHETQCNCGSEKTSGLPCSNFNCAKQRELNFPQKSTSTQIQIASGYSQFISQIELSFNELF